MGLSTDHAPQKHPLVEDGLDEECQPERVVYPGVPLGDLRGLELEQHYQQQSEWIMDI